MRLYVKGMIGLLNLLTPKNRPSYLFLLNTILKFYSAAEFTALLAEAGFSSPSATALFPGAVAVHTAVK
jgi:ubiquinone/menaquinone biosynthesis C-methylase UbiE